ncbi:zinc finger domain-containing protein [Streptomyces similanensis]|uniref:DNA-binding phage zinc finger domain-containing protein n=1 Tax=Streptomyces similanensis TaxID=1274988 RepID=A0ABP9L7Y2_9ACTN
MKDTQETDVEVNTTDLMAGKQITLDEMAVELSAIELRLRQLARAAETPATPVELADIIKDLRSSASGIRDKAGQMHRLARIVEGDVPLARAFPTKGDPWGKAARGTDRESYGGPALVPTCWQLLHLAEKAGRSLWPGKEEAPDTTTYPEAMDGVGRGWESKEAQARRRRERDAAVRREVLLITCERCAAGEGEQCRTVNGRISENPHTSRQREAEATVDARLGYLGDNPVAVLEA